MAEAEQGTIIKDLSKSLPTIEDFYYNDLEGYDSAQLPDDARVIFYQEAPPETAEFLGLSANGALLSIKVPKEAFNTNNLQGIISNAVTGNGLRVDLSKAEYGGFDNVKEMLERFKSNPEASGYYATIGADNQDLYERNGMAYAANLRLLYTNLPELPRFTSTEIEEDEIIHKSYGEIKDKTDQYKFCKTPYPYDIQHEGSSNGDVSFSCSNYKQSEASDKYGDTDQLSFVKNGNVYEQVIELDAKYDNRYDTSAKRKRHILTLNSDKSTAADAVNGYKAKDILIQDIEEAKDIRIVLDVNSLNSQSGVAAYRENYPIDYTDKSLTGRFSNYINDLKNKVWDDGWYKYAGYVPYGLDQYHRISGVIYVQKEVENPVTKEKELVWYNLNKKMIAETNNLDSPTTSTSATARYHIDYGPTELKPYTYDYANRTYVDNFWQQAGEYEKKRIAVQKEIFKNTGINLFPTGTGNYKADDDVLYQWTVSLGDVTLFIPPESIRVVSQTDTVRVPLMRARGSIAKGRERSMQYIELNLFFNDEKGINGVAYTVKSPNGKTEFTYKMNGFRALLAQMKFTPYLPIINKYINEDLGIFAVCIEHINIGTVPGFPKLLKAQILLSKFNWQVYMPEIPLPENDSSISKERRNPFSACIDYDTMRWYYQKCIILGDELDRLLHAEDKAKRITVNSLEFYKRTIFANRTALLPCHFIDPNISIYVADEDHLKKLLQIKQDAMKNTGNVNDNYNPTENESRFIKECNQLTSKVDIPTIYAKYAGMANVFLASLYRVRTTNKEDVTDDGRGGKITFGTNGTVTYKGKIYHVNSGYETNEFLNDCLYQPMVDEYKKAVANLKNEDGDPIVNYVLLQQSDSQILIRLNTASYLTNKEFKDTVRESTVYLKQKGIQSKVSTNDVFKDSLIALKIAYSDSIPENQQNATMMEEALNKLQNYYRSSNTISRDADVYDSLKFLDWCKNTAKGIVNANDEASRLKQSIDYEDLHTMKYNLLLENALVTNFQATVGNTYARIGVTGIDGAAPQYMGGQDIHITWTIETTDDSIASTFKSLPELTAYYTRVYRKVLPVYPIKIDSEFTRMMGVQEITIDNVVVTTVEGFPGLYRIVVNALSVDRTLRNKEALKLLETTDKGITDSRKRTQVNLHDWTDLDTEFSKAEVYPDLELPTLKELGEYGWRYIRYRAKERETRPSFYVDPDFYFIYPELTVGRAILQSLRCTFEKELTDKVKEDDITQLLTDTSGQQRVVRKNGGIDRNQMNTAAAEDIKDREVRKVNAVKQDRLYYTDALKSLVLRMPLGSFDICNKVRCVFTEPYYIKECKWAKDETDIPEEQVLEIPVDNSDAETLEEAAKTAGPEYARIQFVNKNTKEIINTIANPNWNNKDSKKITELFQQFEQCADALEKHLTENDDGLATVSGDYSVLDAETKGINKTEPSEATSTAYSAGQIQQYLSSSGFWKITKQYHVFQGNSVIGDLSDISETDRLQDYVSKETDEQATVDDVTYLIQAVADALCGKEECTTKNKTKGFGQKAWQANVNAPYAANNTTEFTTKEEVESNSPKSYGIFGIKKYTYNELYRILPREEQEALEKSFYQEKDQWYVLDPYFRMKDNATKEKYLLKCATNASYCAVAFLRIVIWYMAKLLRYHIIPSIEFDIKRQENINAADASTAATEFLKKQGITHQSTSTLYTELKAFAKNNGQAFDTGKFFAAIVLALTEEGFGKNTIFDLYNQRNFTDLNRIVKSVVSVKYKVRNENDPTFDNRNRLLRRYLLALYGYDIIKDPNKLGFDITASPASKFLTNYNTKIALEACSNPVQYMRDSFFDMIRHDYRGRMLRAFPTFYMVFADEGREIGLWKLHDNFYNVNAIHEIQIVKSRKIPADTCKIVLSNMFQTFTTNDEDCTINYKGSFGDLWESFLDPKVSAQKEELKRLAAKKINRAKLQTGVRIHVRMGYGANAADLPCAFNGVIAEIKPGELVEIVAQGDGVELCNPIYMEDDADIIQNNDNFATMDKCVCGLPPKDILQGFLTAKGGPIPAWLRNQYRSNWFTGTAESSANRLATENNEEGTASKIFDRDGFIMYGLLNIFENNPFGIRHFGDPAFRDIFAQGEPAQNLYEITNKSDSIFSDDLDKKVYFGDGALDLDDKLNGWSGWNDHNDLPYISFKPYGRTVWDIMHICKSIAPDYMTGIAPFQFRSTVFLGKPHYYYAYKYVYEGNGKTIYEKRKPFQQWHLYNNFSDIVENKISASSEKMKTNATGTYEIDGDSGIQKTVPMWVDQDIYPEYQKSMVVDTKLYGKSWLKHNAVSGTINAIPILGWLTDKIMSVPAYITNKFLDQHFASWFDQRGSVTSHSKTAEDAVIDALKNSVKEMYQGYLIVLGDPSIKPNDRIQISDAYEDMDGMCDVREVVHTLNPHQGYTTTITPDCISAHDMKSEILKMNWAIQLAARTGTATSMALLGHVFGNKLYDKGAEVIKNAKAYTTKTELFNAFVEDAKTVANKAKELKTVQTASKSKTVNALKSMGLGVAKGGAGIAKAVLTPAAVATGIFTIIGGAVNTALYRTIKGMQVLYIFPLRKYGKALIAGLDGQQGLVYGTLQFNTSGPVEQLIGYLFGHSKDAGFVGAAKNFLKGLLIDENVMELADKFDMTEDAEFRQKAMSGNEKDLSEADLQSVAGLQMDKSLYRAQSAYSLSLMPRAMVDGLQRTWLPSKDQIKETIWQAVKNRYYIDNVKDWVVNPNLKNLIYIENDLTLKPYFESGILRTLPQVILEKGSYGTSTKDHILRYSVHMPRGESKEVIGIKRTEKQNTGDAVVLDIPYTSQEGIMIIQELCSYIIDNTSYLTKPDQQANNQANKDTGIIISSALIVGSANPLYGSGFHLILTGTGKLSGNGTLKKLVEAYRNILHKKLEASNKEYEHLPLFEIDDKITQINEVGFNIGVPSPFSNNIAVKNIENRKLKEKLSNSSQQVSTIRDGDTIEVTTSDGKTYPIRLLGIDTPESVHKDSSKNVPEGKIASDFTKSLLNGQKVTLEFDKQFKDRTSEHRLLAYVYLEDGRMLQKILLEEGMAKTNLLGDSPKYAAEFASIEAKAKQKNAGFWGQKSSYFRNQEK